MAKRVQISCLGNFGRFGNQLFQYAFAKSYAEKYNCTLEVPQNWKGRQIFNIDDPPIGEPLPKTKLDTIPWGQKNIDLFGYFCAPDFVQFLTRKKLKEWFKIKDKWMDLVPKPEAPYLAAHLRRGDYTTTFAYLYCTVSKKSYLDAISRFRLDKHNVVWVSEDNKKSHPLCDQEKLSFLPDFITRIKRI